jgi:thymidylate synthase (FAD)
MVLPLSTYTQFYWKQDLRNLLHFLKLRLDEHAQWEIREYAKAILRLIEPLVPVTVKAWKEIVLEGGGNQ